MLASYGGGGGTVRGAGGGGTVFGGGGGRLMDWMGGGGGGTRASDGLELSSVASTGGKAGGTGISFKSSVGSIGALSVSSSASPSASCSWSICCSSSAAAASASCGAVIIAAASAGSFGSGGTCGERSDYYGVCVIEVVSAIVLSFGRMSIGTPSSFSLISC